MSLSLTDSLVGLVYNVFATIRSILTPFAHVNNSDRDTLFFPHVQKYVLLRRQLSFRNIRQGRN